jgi:hypothetical protein
MLLLVLNCRSTTMLQQYRLLLLPHQLLPQLLCLH